MSNWTPEILGRALAEIAKDGSCGMCQVIHGCLKTGGDMCIDFACMLDDLNSRNIPVPDHVCRCKEAKL